MELEKISTIANEATVLDGTEKSEVTQSATTKFVTENVRKAFIEAGRPSFSAAPFVSGFWYNFSRGVVFATGSAVSVNTIRLYPIIIDKPFTVSLLGLRVVTAGAGSVQMAVYAHANTTNRPTGNPVISTASQSTAATGSFSRAPVAGNTVLPPGVYWCAINSDVATTVFTTASAASSGLSSIVGASTLALITSSATVSSVTLSIAQTFGTWPDLTGGSFTELTTQNFAWLFFQAA